MHSSRMRTFRSLPYGEEVSVQGGSLSGEEGLCLGGVSVELGLCPGGLCLGISVGRVSVRETPGQRSPGKNMGPETETPQKEHGTRDRDPL